MNKAILVALLVFGSVASVAQGAGERVAGLLNAGRYFELARQLSTETKDSLPPVIRLMAEAMAAHHFNRPVEACLALDKLLADHQQDIGVGNSVNMAYLMAKNVGRTGKYAEASELLRSLVSQLRRMPADSSMVDMVLAEADRMQELAGLGELCRPLHVPEDYSVSFFIDGSIHGYRKGGFLALNATVNGVAQHVVLDTGAGVNVISSGDVERCGLRLTDTGIIMRGVGNASGRLAVADTLRMGRMAWVNVPFYIVDMKTGHAEADSIVGGGLPPILGLPWLSSVGEVCLDFVKRTLTVRGEPSANPARYPNLMLKDNENLSVEVRDGDGRPLVMHFDTGSYETLLSPHWYGMHKEQVCREGTPDSLRYAGVGGVVMQRGYRMPRFKLAVGHSAVVLDSVDVATGVDLHTGERIGNNAFNTPGEDGVVGLDFIERFGTVVINLRDMFIEAKGTSEAYRREWLFPENED